MIVFFHRDSDGYCAAYIFSQHNQPDTMCSIQHGEPIDVSALKGEDVYFLDFCPPKNVLADICNIAKNVVVMYHHKAAESLVHNTTKPDNLTVVFGTNSGSWLAYQSYCTTEKANKKLETLAAYVQDQDLWRFDLPQTKEVNAYINAFCQSLDDWPEMSNLLENNFDEVVRGGSLLIRQRDATVKRLVEDKLIVKNDIAVVNSPVLQSAIGDSLDKTYKFAVIWFQLDVDKFVYSLRASGAFNVTQLAEKFGGGGHPSGNAAGFTAPVAPLDNADFWALFS